MRVVLPLDSQPLERPEPADSTMSTSRVEVGVADRSDVDVHQGLNDPRSLATPFDVAPRTMPIPPSGAPRRPASARAYTLEVVEHWQDLESQVAAWDELAAHAIEPNHFFSAGAVLAAIRHLPLEGEPAFVVVRAVRPDLPARPSEWCGFFPFFRYRTCYGVLVRNLRLLRHPYCFLRVPLVRKDCAAEVLHLVFDWLDTGDAALVELGDQTGQGPYAEALAALLHERSGGAWLSSAHRRALLARKDGDETYLSRSVSAGKLKELRRQERRLSEKGELRFVGLCANGDVETAIDEFLELERRAWKGPAGTAMSCLQADREFFAEVVREAWRSDRLRMTTLRLDGHPVAMKCNFLAAPGSFAFKIAYAEELSQYSPGVLLEVDNIRRLHAEPRVRWMDSCAAPGHPMVERLWKERRLIQSWVVPLRPWGRFATASMPLLQWLARTLGSSSKASSRSPAP